MAAEEEKTEGLPKICAYCGKKALYACACGKRYYSSQKCQKQDWRERHKIECTDEIAVNMPLSAELWAALHSLYHSSAESKKFEVVRYAHTRRPMVRYGWYPPAVISPVPSGRKIRKKPALQLLRQPRPVIFPEQGHSYMPVCRYEEFTHQGSFVLQKNAEIFSNKCQARLIPGEPSEYCGRFFFYEPNSATLLDLKSCACFPTKVAAFYALKVRPFFASFTNFS